MVERLLGVRRMSWHEGIFLFGASTVVHVIVFLVGVRGMFLLGRVRVRVKVRVRVRLRVRV